MSDILPPSPLEPAAMRRAWNAVSADYLARQGPFTGDVWYSPLAPPESDLQLIGPVAGLRVLDFGCGGGRNAVALALRGATVTAIDIGAANLDAARLLAAAHHVQLDFLWGDVSVLVTLPAHSFDLVLATMVLPYLPDTPAFFAQCRRILKPGGRLIFSVDHPIRDCFFDAADHEMEPYPARSYHDTRLSRFRFGATGATMAIARNTIAQWIDLIAASLRLIRVVEPETSADVLDDLWPDDGPLAPLRYLPHTIIFIAQVPAD